MSRAWCGCVGRLMWRRWDGRPVQVIDPPAPVDLELTDYAGLERAAASGRLRELATAAALRPLRLAHDRLFRARLVRLAADEHALVVVVHQTVFDDWSFGVLLAELAALYQAEAGGGERPGLAELPVRFADYARWERDRLQGAVLAGREDYWIGALAGLETSQFPTDRPRPLVASHDGAVEIIWIGLERLDGLRELSRRAGTTLPVTLLAALQVLLSRYTGQTDVVVGTVSANRARPELAPLIGFLANTLPIRCDLSGDPAFTELLGRVRAAAEGAHAHQDLPFAKMVEALHLERDTGRWPVFQVGFAYTEPADGIESAGVVFHADHVELPASKYDISFAAEARGGGLRLETTYTTALFDAATVRRLLGHFEVLLRGVAADPSARLSQLPVLTEAELRRELVEWNDTAAPVPLVCVHQGFQAQVSRTPGTVAAEFEGNQLSYAQLNRQANQIARRLRGLGVGPEVLVGVCMRTGLRRLAALLGIWKAGGGYVPLDPALPAERLSFMMADTAMPVVLTDTPSEGSVPASATVRVLGLDAGWAQISGLDDTDPADVGVTPSNVAYVIYTSGSTGQPKGVVVEHRQAVNFLHGMIGHWRIGPDSAILQFAAFTFDVSVMDMFMPLLVGARAVLASAETLHSPPRLAALIRDRAVTFACLPPAVLALLTGQDFPDLRILLSAGEELPPEVARRFMRPGLRFVNGYGPTEATVIATYQELDASMSPPPIGLPTWPNYRAYVLDADLNPVPVGVTGELHIGGAGVARGYLGRPELTEQRFIPDPFTPEPGARLYKTGDLVRRRPDGTIMFTGRADTQVKIRGLRIELGEIETTLTTHPAIAQAVVTVVTGPAGEQQLAAYLRPEPAARPAAAAPARGDTAIPSDTPDPDGPEPHELDPADLRAHLARTLPDYMIPAHLITVDAYPLNTSGKIDRSALPSPGCAPSAAGHTAPATLIEAMTGALFATLLGREQVGATDSFFDAGGNSLQAMRLISMIDKELGVEGIDGLEQLPGEEAAV